MAQLMDEQKRDLAADMAAGRMQPTARKINDADQAFGRRFIFKDSEYEGQPGVVAAEIVLDYQERLNRAFPVIPPGARPLGARILVQLKATEAKTTESGIMLVKETTDAEKFNNMVGKVIAIGPLAFKKRDTMEPWPEGAWCAEGDYIRVPKWGGDRWEVPYGDKDERALFVVLNDHEVIAAVTGDPLAMKAIY
jgi:co-chaperonin GroES (HSP10)